MSRIIPRAALAAVMLAICLPLAAAEDRGDAGPAAATPDQSWYYDQPTTYQPNARQIVQQKAMARGQQRQFRLASMAWYGMSNSRPAAGCTPFMTLYSPTWQMPGGRPFGWFTGERPVFVFWGR
jgi:hypothetical protein